MSVIVLSQRETVGGIAQQLAYSAWSEAENVAVGVGGARLGLLNKHGQSKRVKARRVAGRVVRRVGGRSLQLPALGSGLINQIEPGDHLVLMAFGAWDLPLVERMRQLRAAAKTISVWMPEVWPTELDERTRFESYAMVDQVFVGIREVMDDFGQIAPEADVTCLPPATDVLGFCPTSADNIRNISVLGVGRRDESQHQQLLAWADRTGRLYLYDTVRGEPISLAEHRQNLAGWYRQARVAICNYGKHDRPAETGGLRIVPGRLFEGMAAGAILVGRPPSETNQREIVGEIVVNPAEQSDFIGVIDTFTEPGAGRQERIRNMVLACRRHDWAHRWHNIYRTLGESIPEPLSARISALAEHADGLEKSQP
jgi:hypothetical protein